MSADGSFNHMRASALLSDPTSVAGSFSLLETRKCFASVYGFAVISGREGFYTEKKKKKEEEEEERAMVHESSSLFVCLLLLFVLF